MPRTTTKSVAKAGGALGDIQSDLQTLRDDVTQLTRQIETLLKDAGSDAMGDVMARLGRAKSTVDDMIATAGTRGLDTARAARKLTDNVVDEVEETVREHPLMTIAVAVGVGFVISSLRR